MGIRGFNFYTMQQTIFNYNQGEGIILENGESLADFFKINTEPVLLGTTTLQYGQCSDLNKWFCEPVEYCGKIKDNTLVFLLGTDDGDLFTAPKTYYETMLYLSPTRFFRMYSYKAGRDMNFINGKWK